MASSFAPPGLFRVTTLAAVGDPWIPDGFHLRCWPSPVIGFPLHPFVAIPLTRSFEPTQVDVAWADARGAPLTMPFDLKSVGGVAEGRVLDSGGQNHVWSWLRIEASPGPDFRADAVAPGVPARVVATRRKAPFSFGDEPLALRVSGEGVVQGVTGMDISGAARDVGLEAVKQGTLFGLPLDGDVEWYASGQGVQPALDRVARAAPSLMGPPDSPDGTVVALNPGDEIDRVLATVADASDFLAAFTNPNVPPVEAVFTHAELSSKGKPLRSSANVTDALMVAGADAGLARYLGLATTLDDVFDPANEPLFRLVAATWLTRPDRLVPGGIPLGKVLSLPPYDPTLADGLLPALLSRFPSAQSISAPLVAKGWELRCLVALAVAGAPSDLPDRPSPEIGAAQWNAAPAGTWTQAVTLGQVVPMGSVAFARLAPPPVTSLHPAVVVASAPNGERAVSMVAGLDPSGRPQVVDPGASDDGGGAQWSAWVADSFGRWSEANTLTGAAPRRPPVPLADLLVGVDRPDSPPLGTAPASPGVLTIQVSRPAAVGVAPGGFPIESAAVVVDAGNETVLTFSATSDTVQLQTPIAAISVGGTVTIEVKASLIDSAGGRSPVAITERRDVLDARRPAALRTSPTLLWAGRRDNAGLSEIALDWDATGPATAWRVYLSDEVRLGNALGVTFPSTMTRAERAAIVLAGQAQLADRTLFSLVTRAALQADAGTVRFRHQVSGSLKTVQFVRVVPLSAGNVEADFASCGLVPIAVPLVVMPSAPSLIVRPSDIAPGAAASFQITARVTSVRTDVLELLGADGSVDPPRLPLVRVRRRPAPMSDPAHASVVATVELTPVPMEAGTYEVTIEDGASEQFPPFAQIAWSAAVAYPAETDHTPGTVAEPLGDVRPADRGLVGPLAGEWGPPSLIVESAVVPAAPDSPTATASVENHRGVTITATNLPVAGRTAPGPYVLEVWRVAAGAPLVVMGAIPVTEPTTHIHDPVAADSYLLVLVDPIGRRSATTVVSPVP